MSQHDTSVSLRKQAAAGGRWTAVSAVASVTIQLLQLAVLGRLLQPTDFGQMAMMMVVIALANSIADFGVGNYLVQITNLSRQFFNRLFALSLVLSTVLFGVIAVTASWFAEYFDSPRLEEFLPWLGLVVVASAVSQVYFSALQRAFEFKVIAVGDVISAFLGLFISVGLALYGYGVWSLIGGQLVLSFTKAMIFYKPALISLQEAPLTCEGKIKNALRFGYFQLGERVLNFASWNLDKIIIGKLLGDGALGIYSVAYQLVMRPFVVLNPIFTRVSLPIFSKIKDDNVRLRSGYLHVVRIIALISFPVYLVIAIAAPAIVEVLLGAKWIEAAPVVSILCGLGFIFSLGNPIGSLILAKERAELGFYYNLIALLVFASAYYFGSAYGLTGVAISFVVAAGAIVYPLEIILRRQLVGMGVIEYFSAIKHHLMAATCPLLVYIYLSINKLMPSNISEQLIAGAGGAVFFAVYLWFTERALIRSTLALVLERKK